LEEKLENGWKWNFPIVGGCGDDGFLECFLRVGNLNDHQIFSKYFSTNVSKFLANFRFLPISFYQIIENFLETFF